MINLKFYKGKDIYSDGSIEDEILEIVRTKDDFDEVVASDNRWPILYHLSSHRFSLLDWYDFDPNGSLLEIGAGCGALTPLFCQKLSKVIAIESSKKRSHIIEERCKSYNNLEIIVGDFYDVEIREKFDYITLIGVLEYSKKFGHIKDPYSEMLSKIFKLLKPGGKLILAIENKFGLKYFAGAREDHTGGFFDGITGYQDQSDVETFGKEELEIMLKSNGFGNLDFYYPYPDYKIPRQIFSDNYLPDLDSFLYDSPNYDTDRYKLFNERLAFFNIVKNKKFDFFSNSFLVIASK